MKSIVFRCIECGFLNVINSNFCDGKRCSKCNGYLMPEQKVTIRDDNKQVLLEESIKEMQNAVVVEFKNNKTIIFTGEVVLNLDEVRYISYDRDTFDVVRGYTSSHIRFKKRKVENG